MQSEREVPVLDVWQLRVEEGDMLAEGEPERPAEANEPRCRAGVWPDAEPAASVG